MNDEDNSKIKVWVEKEFQYNEQRIPSIIVMIGDMVKKKLYLGSDSEIATVFSGNGKRAESQYVGAAELPIKFAIVAESPDTRRELADLLYMCFTHYHRWPYLFEGDDGSSFLIVPSQGQMVLGTNQEVKKSDDVKNTLYIKTVNFTSCIDFTFFDNLTGSKYTMIGNLEVADDSGVISS